MKIEELFTKEAHSKPVKMPIFTPDGEKTDQFLEVIGSESEIARKAKAESMRRAALKTSEDAYDDDAHQANMTALVAAHVVGWSFETKFTEANVIKLLTESPYIRDAVDSFTGQSINFFSKK